MYKKLAPVLIGLPIMLISFVFAFVGLLPGIFLVRLIKRDTALSVNRNGLVPAYRGDWPRWLSIFGTPDERAPGDLTNPQYYQMYLTHGFYVTSYMWYFVRNRLGGLSYLFKVPCNGRWWENKVGKQSREDGLWYYKKPLGFLVFVTGWEIFCGLDNVFFASPTFTFKRA